MRSFSSSFFSSAGVIFKPVFSSNDFLLEAKRAANSPPVGGAVVAAVVDLVPSFEKPGPKVGPAWKPGMAGGAA